MASLYITELRNVGYDGTSSQVMAPTMPGVAEQAVTIGGASTQSDPFSDSTRFAMISTDSACCLAFGTNPTAVTTYHRMAANETRFYSVQAGQRVAVIATS